LASVRRVTPPDRLIGVAARLLAAFSGRLLVLGDKNGIFGRGSRRERISAPRNRRGKFSHNSSLSGRTCRFWASNLAFFHVIRAEKAVGHLARRGQPSGTSTAEYRGKCRITPGRAETSPSSRTTVSGARVGRSPEGGHSPLRTAGTSFQADTRTWTSGRARNSGRNSVPIPGVGGGEIQPPSMAGSPVTISLYQSV
jgi:hypothetical protein